MTNQTVLILSDKSDFLPIWLEAFQQRELKAISTSAPATARSHWLTDAPMLTIVDLSLPFSECLDICRQLRGLAAAPILLILSAPSGEEIMKAYRAGVTECLIQPATPAVILLKALAWSMLSNSTIAEPVHDWPQIGSLAIL